KSITARILAPFLALHQWIGASLQRKLVLAIGGLLVGVSAVFLLLVSGVYQNRLVSEHARASMQINRLLQAALENAMLKRDIPGLKAILADLGAQEDIARVMILNPDMEVRFSSDPAPLGSVIDTDLTHAALASVERKSAFLNDPEAGEVLRSVNPVHNQQPCQVCHGPIVEHPVNGLLVVDYAAANIRADARSSTLKLAGLGLAVILAVCLGMWWALVRLVVWPIRQLEGATRALSREQYGTQVELRGRDEIAGLGRAFNRMSARLQATHARLEESSRFLQELIDAIPDGVRVIDENFRILKANAAYCTLVGQDMAQVVGAACYRSSHGRASQCAHTMVCCPVVELCHKGRGPITSQDQYQRADGSSFYVEVSSAAVEMVVDGEKRDCVVESIRNLDEQAKISQQQRLSEIGLLAAGVAHEIFNPLSSIDLGLTALQQEMQGEAAVEGLDYFDAIRSEIQNCIRITDSLLLLSAPTGEERALIALDKVVPEVASLLQYEAGQKRVEMHLVLAPNTRILGSDSDIRMLLVNLAMNAIHAMPEGGNMWIETRHADGLVELEVRDEGVGIAPGDLDSIFMPFWSRRADSSTGRGLGLSIVTAILDRNEAQISVRSELGKGSTFLVVFRDADAEPVKDADGETAQEEGRDDHG
ncbi:MAG TPA: HAMP domain-containing protein, partial [Aliiroseovarius sp.]|nr:HAMP domain-containing protein [Aliiroseovarius sp.]